MTEEINWALNPWSIYRCFTGYFIGKISIAGQLFIRRSLVKKPIFTQPSGTFKVQSVNP